MARKPKKTKDPASLAIAAVLHAVVIGGVVFWAYKTGQLEKVRQVLLQYASDKKQQDKKPEQKPIQQRQASPKLPPIDTGQAPKMGEGTRRAVIADAPDAAGDTFFQDTRRQTGGASTAGPSGATNVTVVRLTVPTAPPPIPTFKGQSATTIKQLFAERAKEAAATEAFGSEQIARTGASDAGAIINKVSGATIVDGKFAVIRGLSDRYVSTTLNGGEIPSADPYRRSASLDMFPSQVISKVTVAKTFTPDKPGTYTGGGIDITTKSFPERPFTSISAGATYNTQASFNSDFLDTPGGSLDWLGWDDGTRALPSGLSDPNLTIPSRPDNALPTRPNYQQRIADANKIDSLTREMGVAPFGPETGAPPLNHSFSFATGDTANIFTRPFGYFAGMNYRRDFSFYDDGISRRYGTGLGPGDLSLRKDFRDTRAVESLNWAGIVNLAYQAFENQELGFNFLFNQNAEDLRRVQTGIVEFEEDFPYTLNRLQFTERNLTTYQLKGGHGFDDLGGARFDWLMAYSETSQDEPDARFFNYRSDFNLSQTTQEPRFPTRYFRELDEQNHSGKFDLTIPFRQWDVRPAELKFGGFGSYADRQFFDREILYDGSSGFTGDPTDYLNDGNLGYIAHTNAAGRIDYTWLRSISTRYSRYDAQSRTEAGYAMLDMPVLDSLRIVGGARYEFTYMQVDGQSTVPGLKPNAQPLDQGDLLPAVSLIYSPVTNMNFRAAYSQTIARPSFRELAAYRSYDPSLDVVVEGEPGLEISHIRNYDLRWEWFPKPGEILGVSLFYKELDRPIEQSFDLALDTVSYQNRSEAKVYGIEFEARKSLDFIDPLLYRFTLGGNLSLIGSETPLSTIERRNKEQFLGTVDSTRALYDQSPYIFNVDLTYDNNVSGTTASIVYNVSGPRIAIANPITQDVYEQSAGSLDVVVSQRLNRHLSVRLTARNLLNPEIKRTYGKNSDYIYSTYTRGQSFGLSVGADF